MFEKNMNIHKFYLQQGCFKGTGQDAENVIQSSPNFLKALTFLNVLGWRLHIFSSRLGALTDKGAYVPVLCSVNICACACVCFLHTQMKLNCK